MYFKLPLEGVQYHWEFLDSEAFLAGELTLRILNKGHDQTIVVFRDGVIHDGWEMIGDAPTDGRFYFGFASSQRFRTKGNDSLIITLKVKEDLLGQGPYTEGVLAAGVWQMTGSYSNLFGRRLSPVDVLVLHGDPPIAFMECWKGVWPVRITKAEGWKGAKPNDGDDPISKLMRPRGTDGNKCGSHI